MAGGDLGDGTWFSGTMPVVVDLPSGPGVYICYDQQHRIAYIGTSRTNVRGRLQAHHRDPDKPLLPRWAAFYPAPGGDSAAVWELRLIERHRPYLNRMHVDEPEPVCWERKPPSPPPRPWYESDPYYCWFTGDQGPSFLIPLDGSQPWQIAKVVRGLIEDGITEDEIWEACEITCCQEPAGPAIPYMAAVARNRRLERQAT